MVVSMYLIKLECKLIDLRTQQEEEQEIILDTDDFEEAEIRAKKHFEKLGYKVDATHMVDKVEKEWDAEELWNKLVEQEIEERKDLKCEKCRNQDRESFLRPRSICEDCVRKDMYEPIESTEENKQ